VAEWPARFQARYGAFRTEVVHALERFSRCGHPQFGFARLVCQACRKELLLPFSCKRRNFCPSCTTRKSVEWAIWLREHVLAPVPHRMLVATIPKRLRAFFRYDLRLLPVLARALADAVALMVRAVRQDLRPALVLCVQTFGDQAQFHPHLHGLLADCAFDPTGRPVSLSLAGKREQAILCDLFRDKLLRALKRKGLLRDAQVRNLLAWPHSGFSLHLGAAIAPGDAQGIERVARHCTRAPVSLERLTFNEKTGYVVYRSKFNPRTNSNFVAEDATAFLAELCSHIPPPYLHLVRYFGRYSASARRALQAPEPDALAATPLPKPCARRRTWAKLIAHLYLDDPLRCSCGGTLRVVAFIRNRQVIDRIMGHLGISPLPGPDPPDTPSMAEPTYVPAYEEEWMGSDPPE
jgi:hypothetical protein